jgi:hypothetical protein
VRLTTASKRQAPSDGVYTVLYETEMRPRLIQSPQGGVCCSESALPYRYAYPKTMASSCDGALYVHSQNYVALCWRDATYINGSSRQGRRRPLRA